MKPKIRYDVYSATNKWAASYDESLALKSAPTAFEQARLTARHVGGEVLQVEYDNDHNVVFAKKVYPATVS